MGKTFLLALIIVACASITLAQDDYKRWEIFGGYSHNRVDTGSDRTSGEFVGEREGFHGFEAAVTRNVTRYIGLKFDVSGHYKNRSFPLFGIATVTNAVEINSSLYNFLGGVQIKDNSTTTTFKPFGHALAGAAHSRNRVDFSNDVCIAIFPSPCPVDFTDSQTGFAGAFGGGLDIRASDGFDIRAVQVDYNPMRLDGRTLHNFRIGVGIVIH